MDGWDTYLDGCKRHSGVLRFLIIEKIPLWARFSIMHHCWVCMIGSGRLEVSPSGLVFFFFTRLYQYISITYPEDESFEGVLMHKATVEWFSWWWPTLWCACLCGITVGYVWYIPRETMSLLWFIRKTCYENYPWYAYLWKGSCDSNIPKHQLSGVYN